MIQKINDDIVYFDEKEKKFEYLDKTFDSLVKVYDFCQNKKEIEKEIRKRKKVKT